MSAVPGRFWVGCVAAQGDDTGIWGNDQLRLAGCLVAGGQVNPAGYCFSTGQAVEQAGQVGHAQPAGLIRCATAVWAEDDVVQFVEGEAAGRGVAAVVYPGRVVVPHV